MAVLLKTDGFAASPTEEAKSYFRAGSQAYDAGQYRAATRALERAFELTPLPAIAFSLAQSLRLQYFAERDPRLLEKARQLYGMYVEREPMGRRRHDAFRAIAEIEPLLPTVRNPSTPRAASSRLPTEILISSQVEGARVSFDGGEELDLPLVVETTPGTHGFVVRADGFHDEALQAIAVDSRLVVHEVPLRPKAAQVSVTSEAGARVLVDGLDRGSLPLSASLDVPAGIHHFAVLRPGRQARERSFDLERGQSLDIRAELTTSIQRNIATATSVTAGILAALAGAATGWAFLEQGRARELDAQRLDRGLTPEELVDYDDARSQRDFLRTAGVSLLGASAAAAVTALLLYVFDEPSVQRTSEGRAAAGAPMARD